MLGFALADPDLTFAALKATCQEVFDAGSDHEQLIEALLTLACSQQGLEHRQPVNLAEAVEDVIGAPLPPGITDGVTIDTALNPAWVSGDPRLIRQLVTNLVENALSHNFPDGEFASRGSSRARHTFSRSITPAATVPADQIERLLQPFQRLKPDRTHTAPGTASGSRSSARSPPHTTQPSRSNPTPTGVCTSASPSRSPRHDRTNRRPRLGAPNACKSPSLRHRAEHRGRRSRSATRPRRPQRRCPERRHAHPVGPR